MTGIQRRATRSSTPQRRGTAPPSTSAEPKTSTFSATEDLPDDPHVMLLFEGLLWFMYHGTDECQIGIHNATHGGLFPHAHRHDLEIKVWERATTCDPQPNQSCCALKPDVRVNPIKIGDPRTITGIQIDVNRPLMEGVYVYQKGPFSRPDFEGKNDPADWRWLIDFDKDLYHPQGIRLNPRYVNPGIWINSGTFFTLAKTTYNFDLHPDSGTDIPMGNVALIAGGAIALQPGGNVRLTIRRAYPDDPTIITLPYDADKRFQIDIRNACVNGAGKRCTRDDYGSDANDFYLYNNTFTRPSGTRRYVLRRRERRPKQLAYDRPHTTRKTCFDPEDYETVKSNNEAPCGPVGAGYGGG
jgi:hypothetical protein